MDSIEPTTEGEWREAVAKGLEWAIQREPEHIANSIVDHVLSTKGTVFWLDSEYTQSIEGNIDRRNPMKLVRHIEAGAKDKKRGHARGLQRSYEETGKLLRNAFTDRVAIDQTITDEWSPGKIKVEFQSDGSKFAKVLTEYFFAVATNLHKEEENRPSDELIARSLGALIESTNETDHEKVLELIQGASANASRRFKHHSGSIAILEKDAEGFSKRADFFGSAKPALSPEEIHQTTMDHANAVDDLVSSDLITI